MLNEHVIVKVKWTIGEVAELIGTTTSAIRYYAKELGIDHNRNRRGDRIFTAEEVEKMRKVANLAKHWKISAIKTIHERGNLYTALIETQHLLGI